MNLKLENRLSHIKLSIRKISELASKTKDAIRFDIGQPDFDTPNNVKLAAIKAIQKGFTGYTSSFGISELRKAIAEKESAKGLDITENNVLVTVGGAEAITCCLLNILKPGDEIVIPNPYWAPYTFMIANAYGVPVPARFYENGEFIGENIERAVTKKTRAIIVNTPDNPTGRVIKQKHLEEISNIAQKRDLFVISDEVYEKIVFEDSKHFSIANNIPERTFLINSLSKTYAMSGWRIGLVVGKESFIEEMMKTSRSMVACPSSISQSAALEALSGPQESVEEMRKEYEKRRDYAVKKLAKIGLNFISPEGTFYVFPHIKRDPWSFSLGLLKEKKVSVVPGDAFGSAGQDCVRLALTTSMDKIKDGLDRFEEYLNQTQ